MTIAKALQELDAELTDRLRWVRVRIEQAEKDLIEAKRERRTTIEAAMEARWTQERIGEQLGVTKQRVAQIRRQYD